MALEDVGLPRRSRRVTLELPVRWIRRDGSVTLVAADVSAEGLFLRTDEMLSVGTLVPLELPLPDGSRIQMLVIVRFVGETPRGRGAGTEIYSLEADWRHRWLDFYHSLLPRRPLES